MKRTFEAILACASYLATSVDAAIVEDGIWTGNDWYQEQFKIGVRNGVPYSDDSNTAHRITAPLSIDGDIIDSYLTKENVIRV